MSNKETQKLYVRTGLIILLAFPLAWMLSRSYQPGSLIWDGLRGIGDLVSPPGAVPIEFVSTLLLGVYFGLLGLFVADERKRIQGGILSAGTVVGLFVLSVLDILLPNIDYSDPFNWGALVVGLLIGSSAVLQKLIEYHNSDDSSQIDRSFPTASWLLFTFITLVLITGLIQTLLAGTAILLVDIPVTVSTIYLLFGFVKYTSQADVAVIGPRESGKSLLLLGLYLSYRERDLARSAEGYMQDLISQADSITPGEDFPIANTYELEKLWFYLSKRGLFPKRIKITATDHSGELLTRLGEDLADSFTLSDRLDLWRRRYRRYNPLVTVTPGGEGAYQIFEYQIRTADVVLLLVDVERLERGEVGFIDSLETIGTRAQSNGAKVHIVATKCDLKIREFSPVAGNPLDQGLNQEFRSDINHRLRNGYASVDELCDRVDAKTIYPVYYETKIVDGHRIPDLDEDQSLQYQGMDTLGNVLLDGLE